MKKVFCCLLAVCSLLLAGCTQEEKFAYNEEYVFSHIAFYGSAQVNIEDLSSLCPLGVEIRSVNELESYIKKNIDVYSVIKMTEDGSREQIFLKNQLDGITFYEDNTADLKINGETKTYAANILLEHNGDKTDLTISVGSTYKTERFDFKDGYVFYSVELYPEYGIKYMFDND